MKYKIRRAIREGGLPTLFERTTRRLERKISPILQVVWKNSIRKALPQTGFQRYNKIRIRKRKFGDQVTGILRDKPGYEENYVQMIRENVSEQDTVIVVGGWHGVSSVAAAENVGENGKVITYEATKEGAERVEKVAKLNGVSEFIEVRNKVVGEDVTDLKSEGTADACINPSDFEDCDILGIDCDGCEFEVLENLDCNPEKIIVEHHGEGKGENGLEFVYDERRLRELLRERDLGVKTFEVKNRMRYGYEDKIGWFLGCKEN